MLTRRVCLSHGSQYTDSVLHISSLIKLLTYHLSNQSGDRRPVIISSRVIIITAQAYHFTSLPPPPFTGLTDNCICKFWRWDGLSLWYCHHKICSVTKTVWLKMFNLRTIKELFLEFFIEKFSFLVEQMENKILTWSSEIPRLLPAHWASALWSCIIFNSRGGCAYRWIKPIVPI